MRWHRHRLDVRDTCRTKEAARSHGPPLQIRWHHPDLLTGLQPRNAMASTSIGRAGHVQDERSRPKSRPTAADPMAPPGSSANSISRAWIGGDGLAPALTQLLGNASPFTCVYVPCARASRQLFSGLIPPQIQTRCATNEPCPASADVALGVGGRAAVRARIST